MDQKSKLYELLSVLTEAENAAASDEIDFEEIVKSVKDEVDDLNHILKRMEFEQSWVVNEIEQLQTKKSKINKNIKKFKEVIKSAMLFNEFTKTPGEKYQLSLRPTTCFASRVEATKDLHARFPWAIRQKVSYEWEKVAVTKALKENPTDPISPYATIIHDFTPVFSPLLKDKK